MNDVITPVLADLPAPLADRVARHWQTYTERAGDEVTVLAAEQAVELARVWAFSDFVAEACVRDPGLLSRLLASGDLSTSYAADAYRDRLAPLVAAATDEAALGQALRRFRRHEMVRIAWRDLAGRCELAEVVRDLSALADACTDLGLERLYGWHCEQWGTPQDAAGNPMRMVVIGMGKLGAGELNFSSDIDLILAYADEGETVGGRRQLTHQEFFIRLGQRLSNLLGATTVEGFVFRVDLRLRPFGDASALALSFDAMETYYQVHGREWERYAMIKARVVAGDQAAGAELMAMLRPFVYRRYVDFGAFESLREMKAMIEREVQRKGLQDNVKLGAGGIREVEFIGQAFQLIRGGREPALQIRPIREVLAVLHGLDLLPEFVVRELTDAYVFLRNAEHRIQAFADQQTHDLPDEEVACLRLALSMGFPDWAAFEKALRRHMRRVHQHFEQVFAAPQTDHADNDKLDLVGVWLGQHAEEPALAALAGLGYDEPERALAAIAAARDGHSTRALSAQGRARLDRLMPLLIGAVAKGRRPSDTLERLLDLIAAIARRTAYLALLVENPMALSQLVRLCSASTWITRLLGRHPQLLDELLDPRSLYTPPTRAELEADLRERLAAIAPDDLEAQMETLRHFKQVNVLRVAAADVVEAAPLRRTDPDSPPAGAVRASRFAPDESVMVVSDHLSDIAEVILDEVLELAWRHLMAKHGRPQCGDDRVCDKGFAIVAYGKLGGIELGYGSDLDIVFLHSDDSEGRMTDGERPVDNAVFYARLAQRIVHLMTTRTAAGELYELDLRLRPSGASGLLVSSVEAFERYQNDQAWTWEHQALVRARYVAGDAGVAERFAAIRAAVLSKPRDRDALRGEVREMREKMRTHLAKSEPGRFDLKQERGGIADIEFMVQYGVLAWASEHPDLLRFTDNIRLLNGLAERGILPADDAVLLADAYRAFRGRVHRLALRDEAAMVADEGRFGELRGRVAAIWARLMEP